LAAAQPGDADDLGAFGRPREPPAGARARLDERLEAEAQRVPVAGRGDRVHGRLGAFLFGDNVSDRARVEAHRRHDLLAVLQLELLLDRLAVAGRRGYIDDAAAVRRTEIREEDARRAGAPGKCR